MSLDRILAAVLGWTSAVTCALIGIDYWGEPELWPIGPFLATLAGLGALALAAVSTWQFGSAGGARTLLLILLASLAAAFVASNVLALVAADGGVPAVPRPLHVTGVVCGSALYLACLVDVSASLIARRPRSVPGANGHARPV